MTSQKDGLSHGNGGGKKFLYNGPKKKGAFMDEDGSEQWNFNTNTHNNTQAPKEFDVDNIWSVKNMSVPNSQSKAANSAVDGWDRNVGKGFYSRHGGKNPTEVRTTASPIANPSGKTWPRTYNYSYGSPTQHHGPTTNKDFVKFGSNHSHGRSPQHSGHFSGANSGDMGVHSDFGYNSKHLDF